MVFCQVNNLQSIISTGNSLFQIEEFHNKKKITSQRNPKFFLALAFGGCNLMGLLFIWPGWWHQYIKFMMENLGPSSSVNSSIVPTSLVCLLLPPTPSSIKPLSSLHRLLQTLPLLSSQPYPCPWTCPLSLLLPINNICWLLSLFLSKPY